MDLPGASSEVLNPVRLTQAGTTQHSSRAVSCLCSEYPHKKTPDKSLLHQGSDRVQQLQLIVSFV